MLVTSSTYALIGLCAPYNQCIHTEYKKGRKKQEKDIDDCYIIQKSGKIQKKVNFIQKRKENTKKSRRCLLGNLMSPYRAKRYLIKDCGN